MMEKQHERIRSRPHWWEDLRPPPSDVTAEPKTGVNLKQLPTNLKYVFLDTEKNAQLSSMLVYQMSKKQNSFKC